MAIKYVEYTREQRSSCNVTGYSLYVNSTHLCICEDLHQAKVVAESYATSNEVEIYQVLKRRR